MFWRFLVTLVVLFWLVMTALLLRVTYFPEGSRFAELPPGAVLKLFLDRGASGKQLHLYRGDTKIGHVALDLRQIPGPREPGDYLLLLSGMIERGALPDVPGSVSWRVNINLREGRRSAGTSGQVRMPEIGGLLNFNWREGSLTPEFTFHRRGSPPVDDKLLQPFLGQFSAAAAAETTSSDEAQDDLLKVSSRESTMEIAGQNRRGYVIAFRVMDRYRATAFFTEEGELALIDLPEGYRALEPNIHGLVPDEADDPDAGS